MPVFTDENKRVKLYAYTNMYLWSYVCLLRNIHGNYIRQPQILPFLDFQELANGDPKPQV